MGEHELPEMKIKVLARAPAASPPSEGRVGGGRGAMALSQEEEEEEEEDREDSVASSSQSEEIVFQPR
jgi:ribosomal protein L12E/L44/L45/RPP1/RPP2